MTFPASTAPSADAMKDVNRSARPFAIVTGASSGIGLELASNVPCMASTY